jgi:hypothetical protein
VWGPDGPEMGPVSVLRPPDDDDDGGCDGCAHQMRVKRPEKLKVVGAFQSR